MNNNKKSNVIIRDAVEPDIAEILKIQKSAFLVYTKFVSTEQIPPLNETMEDVMRDFKEKSILVAEIAETIIGSIRFQIKAGVCLFEKLSVAPSEQRTCVGSLLVNEVERRVFGKAHKIYLETGLLADNLVKFYTHLGYSGEAILRKHYGNFDWIMFSKFLSNV